jgi:hypothetical protein
VIAPVETSKLKLKDTIAVRADIILPEVSLRKKGKLISTSWNALNGLFKISGPEMIYLSPLDKPRAVILVRSIVSSTAVGTPGLISSLGTNLLATCA